MAAVPISILKAKLSEYLAEVQAGGEVTVTDRGQPIARIVPLTGDQLQENHIANLVRSGLAKAPEGRYRPIFSRLPDQRIRKD